ncbi:IclR family transcriptional regulator [Arthrobacter rhombi]|uniref:IclR family transcriptional regulator n=1 Tax=Arthrobacter rhombi TaxID=71253 RepID=UPI0031D72D6E
MSNNTSVDALQSIPSGDAPRKPTHRQTSPALRRGLDILELFLEPNDGLKIPEITRRLGLPRASVHELVGTLVERGYLRPLGEEGARFALGVKPFQLGGAYERELDLAELGRDIAANVASECDETVQVVVRDGQYAVYVVRIDSTHSVRLVSQVGSRLPAHCTAGGKMLLATLADEELSSLFPDDASLIRMTEHSIDSTARLRNELALIRSRDWAEEHSESNDDVTCVAAPVRDSHGNCLAAMSISVPNIRWSEEGKAHYIDLASTGARRLSRALGA